MKLFHKKEYSFFSFFQKWDCRRSKRRRTSKCILNDPQNSVCLHSCRNKKPLIVDSSYTTCLENNFFTFINSDQNINVAIQRSTFPVQNKHKSKCNCPKCGPMNVVHDSLAHPGMYGFYSDIDPQIKDSDEQQKSRHNLRKKYKDIDDDECDDDDSDILEMRRPYACPNLVEEPLIVQLEAKLIKICSKLDVLEKKIDKKELFKKKLNFTEKGVQCTKMSKWMHSPGVYNVQNKTKRHNSKLSLKDSQEMSIIPSCLKESLLSCRMNCERLKTNCIDKFMVSEEKLRFKRLVKQLSTASSSEFQHLLDDYHNKYVDNNKQNKTCEQHKFESQIPVRVNPSLMRTDSQNKKISSKSKHIMFWKRQKPDKKAWQERALQQMVEMESNVSCILSFFEYLNDGSDEIKENEILECVEKLKVCNETLETLSRKFSIEKTGDKKDKDKRPPETSGNPTSEKEAIVGSSSMS